MATQTSSHLLPFITRSFGSKHLNLIDHYILSLMQPKLLKRVKDQQKNNSFILQTGICLFRYSNQLIKLRISSPGLCDDRRRFHRFTFSYKDTLAFKTKTFGATHLLKRGSFSKMAFKMKFGCCKWPFWSSYLRNSMLRHLVLPAFVNSKR